MRTTLNIGRGVANPVPALVADLSEAGWGQHIPKHEKWLKRVFTHAEIGDRAGTAKELVRHLGVRRGDALDRAVSTLIGLTSSTGALRESDIKELEVMIDAERWTRRPERQLESHFEHRG